MFVNYEEYLKSPQRKWLREAMRLVNAAKDLAGDGFFSDEELEHLAGAAYSTFKAWDELRNNGSNFDE